jgi:hypothetical protein
MTDHFQNYSLKIFDELNECILKKLSSLQSKEIENTINNLMKIENTFNEIENKLDGTLNKLVLTKITKDTETELKTLK